MTAPALEGLVEEVLSPRQAEIARLVAEGLRNQDIAARLGLSEQTVRNHIGRIFAKLGVSNRTMLALWVVRMGGRA